MDKNQASCYNAHLIRFLRKYNHSCVFQLKLAYVFVIYFKGHDEIEWFLNRKRRRIDPMDYKKCKKLKFDFVQESIDLSSVTRLTVEKSHNSPTDSVRSLATTSHPVQITSAKKRLTNTVNSTDAQNSSLIGEGLALTAGILNSKAVPNSKRKFQIKLIAWYRQMKFKFVFFAFGRKTELAIEQEKAQLEYEECVIIFSSERRHK